ncbi:MAG: EAL domain-containing protein [Hydrogenobaculum sp.]
MYSIDIEIPNPGCDHCAEPLDFDFTFAFQPIVDIEQKKIFAHEALVRGKEGQGAGWVLQHVNDKNRYRFDQECRIKSMSLAAKLGIKTKLSINFMPNAVYVPEACIRTTLEVADKIGFDINNIIFEVLEDEEIRNPDKLKDIFSYYAKKGFGTAIDDFGSGYAGLTLLAELQPQFIKLDMYLIRNVHKEKVKQSILNGIITTAKDMNIDIIAEGIESVEEALWLKDKDIKLMQGYLFAKPGFERLFDESEINFPF